MNFKRGLISAYITGNGKLEQQSATVSHKKLSDIFSVDVFMQLIQHFFIHNLLCKKVSILNKENVRFYYCKVVGLLDNS